METQSRTVIVSPAAQSPAVVRRLNSAGELYTPAICAIVVSYFPDAEFVQRLAVIARECERVVVIDNGSPPDRLKGLSLGTVEVVCLEKNVGLATALNRGLTRARELGYRWVITFDQDSTPVSGMANALWTTRQGAFDPEKVAVVGPRLREERVVHEDHRWILPDPRSRLFFRRAPCVDRDLPGVAFVITSGALMDLRILQKIGPMDDSLFIDYIDHDYCLRARQLGYEIIVSAGAILNHNLGTKREFVVAGKVVRPTFHSALRLRYMFRNRRILLRRHAREFPYWAMFDCVFVHYNLLRIVVFEDHRWEKLKAAWLGTWDGWCGRKGEIAA